MRLLGIGRRQRVAFALALVLSAGGARTSFGANGASAGLPPGVASECLRLVSQSGARSAYLDDADRLYYFDGQRWACQLPDRTVLVWGGQNWIPLGALTWQKADAAPVDAPPLSPVRFWQRQRGTLSRSEYRAKYGQDLYFRYGPGHFID